MKFVSIRFFGLLIVVAFTSCTSTNWHAATENPGTPDILSVLQRHFEGISEVRLIDLTKAINYFSTKGLSGNSLYLFPDETYYYTAWCDICHTEIVEKGQWHNAGGQLSFVASFASEDQTLEKQLLLSVTVGDKIYLTLFPEKHLQQLSADSDSHTWSFPPPLSLEVSSPVAETELKKRKFQICCEDYRATEVEAVTKSKSIVFKPENAIPNARVDAMLYMWPLEKDKTCNNFDEDKRYTGRCVETRIVGADLKSVLRQIAGISNIDLELFSGSPCYLYGIEGYFAWDALLDLVLTQCGLEWKSMRTSSNDWKRGIVPLCDGGLNYCLHESDLGDNKALEATSARVD